MRTWTTASIKRRSFRCLDGLLIGPDGPITGAARRLRGLRPRGALVRRGAVSMKSSARILWSVGPTAPWPMDSKRMMGSGMYFMLGAKTWPMPKCGIPDEPPWRIIIWIFCAIVCCSPERAPNFAAMLPLTPNFGRPLSASATPYLLMRGRGCGDGTSHAEYLSPTGSVNMPMQHNGELPGSNPLCPRTSRANGIRLSLGALRNGFRATDQTRWDGCHRPERTKSRSKAKRRALMISRLDRLQLA